jgi:hypothetical protein
MSDPDMPTDDKYVTFKRDDFFALLDLAEVGDEKLYKDLSQIALDDAVVIRRQDKFASPCLLTYAAMIAMVGDHHPEPKVRADLLDIADYFQRQGELAGEEAWKLPDL